MKELSDSQIEKIIDLFKKGASLPEDYRESLIKNLEQLKNSLLFDTKKEYELIYANKEITNDTKPIVANKISRFLTYGIILKGIK